MQRFNLCLDAARHEEVPPFRGKETPANSCGDPWHPEGVRDDGGMHRFSQDKRCTRDLSDHMAGVPSRIDELHVAATAGFLPVHERDRFPMRNKDRLCRSFPRPENLEIRQHGGRIGDANTLWKPKKHCASRSPQTPDVPFGIKCRDRAVAIADARSHDHHSAASIWQKVRRVYQGSHPNKRDLWIPFAPARQKVIPDPLVQIISEISGFELAVKEFHSKGAFCGIRQLNSNLS
ncbi:hypothetical protein DFO80_111102 [Rhodobacter sp. 140A]|nr:hypothetical protein DFO80_111102 [Rhodobacter sp. 140A]